MARGKGNRLTDEEIAALERMFRAGATVDDICNAFDISERVAYRRTKHLRGTSYDIAAHRGEMRWAKRAPKPQRAAVLPVAQSDFIRPLTKQDLMRGRA